MNPSANTNSNPSLTLNTNNLSPVNHMNNVNSMSQPLNQHISQPFSEYTISGVLHFLQKEWRNFDRERNEWEIERAELKAKISCLEGERKAVDNIRNDLMRRVKMLEYALRQERSRYLNNQPTPEPENNGNGTNSTSNENHQNQRPPLTKIPSNYAKHIFKSRSSSSSASSTLTAQKNKQKKEKFKEVIKLCLTELNNLPFTEFNAANSNTSSAGLVDRKFELNWEELDFEPKESSSDPPSRAPPNTESAPTSLRKLYSSENSGQPQYKTMGPSSGQDFGSTSPTNQVSPTNPPMILKKPTPTTTITTDSASPSSDSSKPIPRPVKQDNMSQEEKRNKRITVIAPSDFEGDPYDNANINDSPRSMKEEELKISKSKPTSNATSKNSTISSGSSAAGKLNSILKALGKSPEDGEEIDLDNSGFSNPDATVSGHRSKHENQDLQKLNNLKDDQFIFDDDKDTEPATNLNLKVEESNQLWKPKLTLKSHLDTVRCLDFHDQDLVLCTGSDDGTIKVWDLHNLTINSKKASRMEYDPILVARGHEGPITSVVCSSTQGKIYSSSFDCSIRVWETPNFPAGTQMDNPEKAKIIAKFEGHTDVVWNIKLNTKLSTGDKILLASAGADETVRLWDTENPSNPLLRTFKSSYPDINPTAIDFNHIDNSKLFVSYQNSKIEMIDIETGQVIQEFDSAQTYDNTPNTQISCIMAHPTIHTLVSGHEDKYIRFYDINSGKCNHSMVAHLDAISSLDVSNNGLSIVSGGHDASIRWWDLTNHSCVQEFSAHRSKTSEAVCGVKFHRTYPWLASCGADSGIKMYTCN